MTTAADITVKKNDGTTDIVWSLVSASGGDRSPALWKSQTATGTLGQKPSFSIVARSNQAGNVRRVDVSASYPSVYTNSNTGQTEVRSTMTLTASFAVPQNVVAADINEFASQVAHLINSSMSVGSVQSGFAPT
jgi:hypothetical protein